MNALPPDGGVAAHPSHGEGAAAASAHPGFTPSWPTAMATLHASSSPLELPLPTPSLAMLPSASVARLPAASLPTSSAMLPTHSKLQAPDGNLQTPPPTPSVNLVQPILYGGQPAADAPAFR